jgi:hypothetical protein
MGDRFHPQHSKLTSSRYQAIEQTPFDPTCNLTPSVARLKFQATWTVLPLFQALGQTQTIPLTTRTTATTPCPPASSALS